eukprot:1953033-Karenia_brevis.AAC.1
MALFPTSDVVQSGLFPSWTPGLTPRRLPPVHKHHLVPHLDSCALVVHLVDGHGWALHASTLLLRQ